MYVNMEQINKRLTPKQKDFFNEMSLYIDQPIYFYGSITRQDYIQGKSDIDIDIFTDNEISTIYSLCNFLNVKRSDFRKSVYKIDSRIVYGYKCKYQDVSKGIEIEVSLYNNKYKEIVSQDHNSCKILPIYISVILIIIKFLYYNLNILPVNVYKKAKQLLMNKGGEFKFFLLDN